MDGYTAVTLSFFGFLFVAGVLAAMALLLARPASAQPRTVWHEPEPHGTPWRPAEWQLCGSWEDAVNLCDPTMRIEDLRAAWLDYHSRNPARYFAEADAFQAPVVRR